MKIESVAFDVGGVLAKQDLSLLTEEEILLLKIYMNRNNPDKLNKYLTMFKCNDRKKVIKYAKSQMSTIYPKIHILNKSAIETLESLKSENITPSIWTNNIHEINCWFEQIGLFDYIDPKNICNSINIGYDKPNFNFYRESLKQLQKMPSQVLFIDDKNENIESARQCLIPSKQYYYESNLSLTQTTLDTIEKINRGKR